MKALNLTLKKSLKASVAILTSSLLAACAGFSFHNEPSVSPEYSVITVEASDLQLYRAINRALGENSLEVLAPDASTTQLKAIVERLSMPFLSANIDQRYARNVQPNTPNRTHNITECVGSKLNFACVAKYVPHLKITYLANQEKPLSTYRDGTTAQQLVLMDVRSDLYIPYLGKIPVNEILTDQQLYNAQDPLTNLGTKEQLSLTYKSVIAERIALKVLYILEQSSRVNHVDLDRFEREQQRQKFDQQVQDADDFNKGVEQYIKRMSTAPAAPTATTTPAPTPTTPVPAPAPAPNAAPSN